MVRVNIGCDLGKYIFQVVPKCVIEFCWESVLPGVLFSSICCMVSVSSSVCMGWSILRASV